MEKKFIVGPEQTAEKMGSGGLPVYATPALVAAVENTCYEGLQATLAEGFTSVGGSLELQHLAPSPVGAEITIKAEITEAKGKKTVFSFTAYEGEKLIGKGRHIRFTVEIKSFLENL